MSPLYIIKDMVASLNKKIDYWMPTTLVIIIIFLSKMPDSEQ